MRPLTKRPFLFSLFEIKENQHADQKNGGYAQNGGKEDEDRDLHASII